MTTPFTEATANSGQLVVRKADSLSQTEITSWLRALRGHPHVPGSGFDVTAVFKAQSAGGEAFYFAGVNAENFDNRLGTHAEEGAIAAMATALGKSAIIKEGWVMAAPKGLQAPSESPMANIKVPCCGNCRQRIVGFTPSASTLIHSVSLNGDEDIFTMRELLTGPFSFRDFAPELQQEFNARAGATESLSQEDALRRLVRPAADLHGAEIFSWLSGLESVDFASKTCHSAIVRLTNGYAVAGVKTEDAAYTGTNSIQSALAIATTLFGDVGVEEVWCLGSGREERAFSRQAVQPLPLSAIQTLGEFAQGRNIPVHLFNAAGRKKTLCLNETVALMPTFTAPRAPAA